MKKISKIIALALALLILIQPASVLAETVSKSPFIQGEYTHQSQFDGMNISMGVDLSYHNGDVDFDKIKANGVEFAFLRVGYRGYGKAGTLMRDTRFEEYYQLAKKAGIKIGVYFYSQAITVKEAEAEANLVLDILNTRELDLPVVFDYEFAPDYDGRLNVAWRKGTLNKTKSTNNALAFCRIIEDSGYKPMVYASKFFLYDNLNRKTLEDNNIGIWLAHYTNNTDYDGKYQVWQYSSSGSVEGVEGRVDCNFMYLKPNVQNSTLFAPVLRLTYREKKSVTVRWDKVKKAEGYEVMLYKNGVWSHAFYTKENVARFKNLTPATNYIVKVRAYRFSQGARVYSKYSKNLKVGTKPGKVYGIKSTFKTDTYIDLTWKKVGSPSSYNVFKYNSKTKKYELYKTVTTNKVRVTGLNPLTRYAFKVQAVKNTNDGETFIGEKSEKAINRTRPKKPEVKTVKSPKYKRISVSWKKVNRVEGYQVQWSTTKDFSSNFKTVTVKGRSTTTKTIKTAQSNRYYYVRVRSYVLNDGLKFFSPWSKTYKVKVK